MKEALLRLTVFSFSAQIRVSTHEHEHGEHCLCTQSLLKRVFDQLTLVVASSSSHRHGSPDILGDRHVWVECMWFSRDLCRDAGNTTSKVSCYVEPS